jgi:hypothetical protein
MRHGLGVGVRNFSWAGWFAPALVRVLQTIGVAIPAMLCHS